MENKKYRLQDLIDMDHFQNLQDRLNEIYSFPSAIIDNDGNILTATAWQDICTQFHRKNKDSERHCIQSDQYIQRHLHEANPAVSYRCPHGLVDNATPIIINGIHYGNFFTGQFFLEDPDMDFFRAQAKKYGFKEVEYLDAVKRVPIWSQKQLASYLFFIKGLIAVIAESGLKRLKEIELRKQMEVKEDRHRSILQTALDGFWLTDMKGQLLEVNDSYCRMSGYSKEELLTLHIVDLEANESPEMAEIHMKKFAAQGSDRFESRHRRKDGTVFDVEVSSQFRAEEGGRCVCFLRDITGRKRAEGMLRATEARFRTLSIMAPVGIYLTDPQGQCLYANPSWCEMAGMPQESALGLGWIEGLHPEDRSFVLSAWSRMVASHGNWGYEYRFRTPEGKITWVYGLANKISDPAGNITGYVGINLDITGRKQAEAEKADLDAKLQQLQKTESLGRMAGAIAHTFNNHLYVVTGSLELVLDDLPGDAEIRENLLQSLMAARKAAAVSRQMLTYLGQTPGNHDPIDLSEVCRQSLPLLKAAIPKGMILNVDFPDSGPVIRSNEDQIQQILVHLITNAWESIPGNQGSIGLAIRTVAHGEIPPSKRFPMDWQPQPVPHACLEVSDTGCGISNQDIEKLFDPFFTTKLIGRGMGLPVVMGIVKTQDGCITVNSEPGRGSIFRVYLPISTDKIPLPLEPEKPAADFVQRVEKGGTVLLIEDEAMVRNTAKVMLTRLGYTVIEARDGIEAMEIFQQRQNEICCVLSDLTMPGMDGWETLTALRRMRADVPVILASGHDMTALRRMRADVPVILASGHDKDVVMAGNHPELPRAFLYKPYSMSALKEALTKAMGL